MDGLSNSDVALLANNDGMNGWNGMIWLFAILALMGGGFGNWGGNNRGDFVTQADLSAGLAAQTSQSQLQSLAVETANNNYETAQLINAQTNAMLQQNNTNLINAIQGFNQVNLGIQNQTNVLSTQLQALGAQMNECCCSIKTQMLEDKLAETQQKLAVAENTISNANQSQYLLGQLGRFVAWAGTGAPAVTTGS